MSRDFNFKVQHKLHTDSMLHTDECLSLADIYCNITFYSKHANLSHTLNDLLVCYDIKGRMDDGRMFLLTHLRVEFLLLGHHSSLECQLGASSALAHLG